MTLTDLLIVGLFLTLAVAYVATSYVTWGLEVRGHRSAWTRTERQRRWQQAQVETVKFWTGVATSSESPVEVDLATRYLRDIHGVEVVRTADGAYPTHNGYASCMCLQCVSVRHAIIEKIYR